MGDYEDRMKKGFEILKQMGREDTMLNQKELYPDLYNLSVGYLFGEIWSRPHLSMRDRELITMASNISLARPVGTHLDHLRTVRDRDTAQHVAVAGQILGGRVEA